MPNKPRLWNTGKDSPPSSRCDYTFVGLIVCDLSVARVEVAQGSSRKPLSVKGVSVEGVGSFDSAETSLREVSAALRMTALIGGRTASRAQDFLALLGILELFARRSRQRDLQHFVDGLDVVGS